ncbi:substrate-binding domain-containing protein [Rhodobacterales bacterium HKCCE2091]|nr:substrate-binding domain-containing protein [Rhodobacterales bacterium HKCCE2091]
MARPTIRDLAEAAGVSVSTVNRVLGGAENVRAPTVRRVLDAAEEIGFYGVGTIQSRVQSARPKDRFVVILQQPGRHFYQELGRNLELAAQSFEGRDIRLDVVYMEDLSSDRIAAEMLELGAEADGIAIVTAEHPLIREAIDRLSSKGVPVIGVIAPLNASANVGFVGLDNWKVGRTAAWAFNHLCRTPGKIGILVGNHRYRNQDLNESGFRSYFREHGRDFTLLEPLLTYESSAVAREMTERLLAEHPDLVGLYISGGGITGAISALRDSGRSGELVAVGYELFDITRAALIDGTLTLLISHPLKRLAEETIAGLVRSKVSGPSGGSQRLLLDFEIYTSENI